MKAKSCQEPDEFAPRSNIRQADHVSGSCLKKSSTERWTKIEVCCNFRCPFWFLNLGALHRCWLSVCRFKDVPLLAIQNWMPHCNLQLCRDHYHQTLKQV
eukprot:5778398-Amphidinium_carterae.1